MSEITPKTWIPLGASATAAAALIGGAFWAATVQTDIKYIKRDISDIKSILSRQDHIADR